MALMLLAILHALVLAVTARAIVASRAVRRAEDRSRALNAAEAGLADAVQRMLVDNVPSRGEGRTGTCAWEVEAGEELRAPGLSVATFDAEARCREQSRRLVLRLVVERDHVLSIRAIRRLDWTPR